uniref:Secretoglobin family 1C member 1 n=1 Tax=Sarcophilus harrisii TaxID=9305 RepID=A0A7N4NX83_SARHA
MNLSPHLGAQHPAQEASLLLALPPLPTPRCCRRSPPLMGLAREPGVLLPPGPGLLPRLGPGPVPRAPSPLFPAPPCPAVLQPNHRVIRCHQSSGGWGAGRATCIKPRDCAGWDSQFRSPEQVRAQLVPRPGPLCTMKGPATMLLLLSLALCWSLALGESSDNEFFLEFLQTLLAGSLEDLYEGPLAPYDINPATKAAMAELKSCIDNLAPVNKAELVKLLVGVLSAPDP